MIRQSVRMIGSSSIEKISQRLQGDQWFGWSERSNTAVVYQNYLGEEAADSLGAYFGVAQRQCTNINCQELTVNCGWTYRARSSEGERDAGSS